MKQLVVTLALAGATWAGIDWLADLTQTRPEPVRQGSTTGVTFEVKMRGPRVPARAAETLWGACQFMVRRTVSEPGIVPLGGNRFYVEVKPELGATGRRRLHGCLEDGTVDVVRGRVIEMRSWGPGEGQAP